MAIAIDNYGITGSLIIISEILTERGVSRAGSSIAKIYPVIRWYVDGVVCQHSAWARAT